MTTICPTCGRPIYEEDEHIWWLYQKEYCSESCVRAVTGGHMLSRRVE